ncbi:uncharacterized protein LOC134261688 [Saccostrea cucullata]|uniref:uncharacterized protein LOC134261688 n=1 Tax=Saccostrea cuccullata TaxID=36930 RepID=UPI002ED00D6F
MVLESKTQKVYRDPFAVKPLPKAHYHPSKHKYLSKSQRKTALGSPLKQEDKGDKQPSVEDEVFLKGGNRYLTKTPPPDDNASSKFDESWPSSERPSSVGLTGTDDRSPYSLHKMLDLYGKRTEDYSDVKQTLSFTETDLKGPPGEGASTLQRVVRKVRIPHLLVGCVILQDIANDWQTSQIEKDKLLQMKMLCTQQALRITSCIHESDTKVYKKRYKEGNDADMKTKELGKRNDHAGRLLLNHGYLSDAIKTENRVFLNDDIVKKVINQMWYKRESLSFRRGLLFAFLTVFHLLLLPPLMITMENRPLQRRGKQTGVEPHLHLMCDLLPCQHSQQYVGKTPRSPTTERSKQEGRQSKISQSSRSEDNNCKGESESSDLEEKTGRYKYLEAERPDVEATKPKTSESENRIKESASDIPKRKKNHESQHVKSDVKHSSKSRAQEDEAEGEENIPRPRECHSPSMKRFESVNSAIGQVIKDRLFTSSLSTVIDSVDNSLLDQNRQSVEITESTRISPPELSPPDPKPPSGLSAPDSRVKEKQRTGTQKERKVKTGSVPEEAGKGQNLAEEAKRGRNLAELENEESYESDGEFPEDQLLQILRAQRSQFEQQLGHIDKLLQKLSPLS